MRPCRWLFLACLGRRLVQLWGLIATVCLLSALYVIRPVPDSAYYPRRIGDASRSRAGYDGIDAHLRHSSQRFGSHRPIQRSEWTINGLAVQTLHHNVVQVSSDQHLRESESKLKNLPLSLSSSQGKTIPDVENVRGSRSRFVIGLNFWEQLTMATSTLFKLMCLAADWQSRVVLPFTYNSRLYGLPSLKPDDNFNVTDRAINFGNIFDRGDLDRLAISGGLPPMVDFDNFLTQSLRGVTIVHFIPEKFAHELDVLQHANVSFENGNVVDCKSSLQFFGDEILHSLDRETGKIGAPSFYIDRYFCVSMMHLFTPMELAFEIGLPLEANRPASVIVVNWRGMSRVGVFVGAKGAHLNNRILMANVSHKSPFRPDTIIEHSSAVIAATKWFMQHRGLLPDEYIGVHIRGEKLGLRESRMVGSTRRCLLQAFKFTKDLVHLRPTLTTIIVTDSGPYSSDTCVHCRGGRSTGVFLAQRNTTPVYFEPGDIGAPRDNGFAAVVEMEVLVYAKELVVCGGGGFQQQLKQRYFQRRGGKRVGVYKVCVDDRSTRAVLDAA